MKAAVLGAGLMGKQAAKDLIASDKVEKVYLADVAVEQALAFKNGLQSDKLEVLQLNANDDQELAYVLSKADVAINALFYTFNKRVAKAAIECGVHVVDLGGHIGGATKAVLALHEKAVEKGVTVIPDLGVAPGMINILAGYGAAKLDKVDEIKLFVGGIPVNPEPPLEYNHVFSLDGVFDHYTDPSYIIRDGKLLKVPSLSETEPIAFEGFNELEAFHTSGGTSTLLESFRGIKTLEYKTVRYKGHADKFRLLVDLGFTDRKKTVVVDGHVIKVRDVLREVLKPITALGDKQDAVVMRVIVAGSRKDEELAYIYDMVTLKDMEAGITAMARATAFTVSVAAQMIGTNIITERGAHPPELIVPGDKYIEEMATRGVLIKETVHYSTYQS
ncbi:saccharopine dehydrogenase family protein [Planomicrobium sp. CPCC 101079]|uniref:saccharopine dehydrogenase family protein n=1 Tax=Planomicrobium sp. CPCC 101079 TaxID=2599618 RepID=UPI0011B3A030|nr:saccharopine dehydrogenase C-terminal domain-containing protein [Planomicrobium sp. CPCC 101079]TWT03422.1 saccharopine dehydrogenase [Planomicrobium sp. CPCC 101079]